MAGFNIAKLHMPFFPFFNEPNSSCFARYRVTVVESVASRCVWKHPSTTTDVYIKCGLQYANRNFIFDN